MKQSFTLRLRATEFAVLQERQQAGPTPVGWWRSWLVALGLEGLDLQRVLESSLVDPAASRTIRLEVVKSPTADMSSRLLDRAPMQRDARGKRIPGALGRPVGEVGSKVLGLKRRDGAKLIFAVDCGICHAEFEMTNEQVMRGHLDRCGRCIKKATESVAQAKRISRDRRRRSTLATAVSNRPLVLDRLEDYLRRKGPQTELSIAAWGKAGSSPSAVRTNLRTLRALERCAFDPATGTWGVVESNREGERQDVGDLRSAAPRAAG